ncbi:LysR substrate-binding domain-containing protein [Streptomyces griseiscabiei]|uniref:LysR substrate-binding domain-containing protein n=1 Tax=Streptomyces griseiscabiei TaxID=2993540 RepID=UPI003EB73639
MFARAAEGPARLRLEFRHVQPDEVAEALHSGEVDVVFAWGPRRIDGVRTQQLCEEERVLLVPADSELAGTRDGLARDGMARDGLSKDGLAWGGLSTDGLPSDGLSPDRLSPAGLSLDALADVPFLVPAASDPEFVRWALVEPRPGGKPAPRGPVVRDFDEALACVAVGLGVHLVPRSVAESVNHAGIVALPVRDIPPSSYLMFLPARVTSSVGTAFVELVLRVRAAQAASGTPVAGVRRRDERAR